MSDQLGKPKEPIIKKTPDVSEQVLEQTDITLKKLLRVENKWRNRQLSWWETQITNSFINAI